MEWISAFRTQTADRILHRLKRKGSWMGRNQSQMPVDNDKMMLSAGRKWAVNVEVVLFRPRLTLNNRKTVLWRWGNCKNRGGRATPVYSLVLRRIDSSSQRVQTSARRRGGAEHFWSRDVSEHVSATCLLIDHKATFSLSAHLRDQRDVLGEQLEPTEIRLEDAQQEGFKWEKEDLCPAGSHRSLRCTSLFARSPNEDHSKRDSFYTLCASYLSYLVWLRIETRRKEAHG